jgi:hypothetical protein
MPLRPKYRKMQKSFQKEYGTKKGTEVFYATANKRKWKMD